MMSGHDREAVKTIALSTVCEHGLCLDFQKMVNNGVSSMTSEHGRETVETIDQSTIREHGPFLDY